MGLLSAGLDGWMKGRAVLAGTSSYRPGSVPEPESPLLPANERRRSSDAVRWALHVADEAVRQSGLHAQESPPCLPLPAGKWLSWISCVAP